MNHARSRPHPGGSDGPPPGAGHALGDTDTGRYAVRTVTGSYVLDLTRRRLMRAPVTLTDGARSMTVTFDVDGAWLPLVRLAVCVVGEPMRATVDIDGARQPLRTSPVQTIVVLDAQERPTATHADEASSGNRPQSATAAASAPAPRLSRRTADGSRSAVIVDVDGTVASVHPQHPLPWGDEAVAGNVFGPVLVSRRLCERLDALGRIPGVSCWWLTSWSAEMRAAMDFFPGRDWPVVAEPDAHLTGSRGWWKLRAVEEWLDAHPEISRLAWCDDDLRGGRPAAVRRRLADRGLAPPLLIAPSVAVGLTPADLDRLEGWARAGYAG